MSEILTDNRFELIEKYKQKLINSTNIDDDKKDIAAIDNILFRFWQMGWLDKLEESSAGMTASEYRERMIQAFHNADCDSLIAVVVLPTEKEFQHLEWLLKKEYVPFLEKSNKALKAPQWIPVSERLPEEDCETGKGVQYSDFVLMSVEHKEDEEIIVDYGHTVDGKWYSDYTDCFIPQEWKVIAWMPLPKPYEVKE